MLPVLIKINFMKKKLLLSFAVFATAVSVNAQKKQAFSKAPHRNASYDAVEVENSAVKGSLNPGKTTSISQKRGAQTIVDTSLYFYNKRVLASPITSGVLVNCTPTQAKDSNDVATAFQIVKNNSMINLRGIMVPVFSVNKGAKSANVVLKIYDVNTGATLAQSTKNVAYSSTNTYATTSFNFTTPLAIATDFIVSIEPVSAVDSFVVSTSGAYRDKKITCNITGNQLTLVTPAPSTNLGTGFSYHQPISGAGIPNGTIVTAFNSTSGVYTISNSVASPLTSVVVTGTMNKFQDLQQNSGFMYLRFPVITGTTNPDVTKTPAEYPDYLIWINDASTNNQWAFFDANLSLYPIYDFSFEATPVVDNKCLGTNSKVNVSYSNAKAFNIARNPFINKLAFFNKYGIGYTKSNGYYATDAKTASNSFADTIGFADTTKLGFAYTATNVAENDTLTVNDYVQAWGYITAVPMVTLTTKFLLSSTITDSTSSIKASYGQSSGQASVFAKGGFAPYTYAWSNNGTTASISVGKGTYTAVVTDANGCSSTSAPVTVGEFAASISEISLSGLNIYPNPTSTELNVKFNAHSAATVELVNVAGQVISSKDAGQFANVTFDTSNLNAGVYFVNIKVAEGTLTHKVVKQ